MTGLAAWLLPEYSGWLVGYIYFSFLLAGVVKGFLGMGVPTVLMITLTLFIPPVEAIALIVIPALFANLFQFLRSSGRYATVRRYAPFAITAFAVIVAVSVNILRYPEAFLLASIGFVMMLFSLNTLFGIPLRLGPHPGWQVLGGAAAGILGGLSTIWSPPVVMYLVGRDVGKEEFIGAVGYLFLVSSIGLMLGLGSISVVTPSVATQSVLPLAAVLAGFRVGEYLRGFIDTEFFRKCILGAFLVMGARLVLVGLLP